MTAPDRRTGRAFGRAPFFALVLALLLLIALTDPRPAHGQDDAIPTWWHEAAGLTPLLTAPPPPNPATICLIDTGVTPTPDLDITARWAYDGGTLDDVHATPETPGHGTLVAHFAAGAVNGWGGAGAFPHARISSVRVFPREGGASWREYIAAISRCLKLDANTKVIVISIGGQEIEPGEADELEAHIERTRDRYGANVVVAAGNGGARPDFPGRFSASFTVAGLDPDGGLCGFSARGDEVDIAAPGCALPQTGWDGRRWSVEGTSFAAPIVGGLLAALRSHVPSLSARDAEWTLTSTARAAAVPVADAKATFRAAGVAALVAEALGPSVAPSDEGGIGTIHATDRHARVPRPRLPRPRTQVVRRRRHVLLTARNRPPGASLEIRTPGRRMRRRGSRVRLPSATKSARCRFVAALASSPWTTVRL